MRYGIYTESGRIDRVVTCALGGMPLLVGNDEQAILMDVGNDSTHYVRDGDLVEYPAKPSASHVFDFIEHDWYDPRTLADLKASLTIAATAHRWIVETGGIELPGGIRVGTEKSDQDRVTSVIVNAHTAGVESVDFKAKSGWVTLTVAEVQGIATAIARHVQACFTAERAHHEAIAALPTLAAAQAYDVAAGWP